MGEVVNMRETEMTGPMLDKLAKARVFSVSWDGVGMFRIQEECDGYFRLDVAPDELVALGRELINAAVNKGE